MHFATIKNYDIANGEGIRVSIFVSGCRHHCPGCFNAEAWDFNYGKEFTDKEIEQIIEMLKPDYISGLSLLGGEPFEIENQTGLLPLVKKVKETYPSKKIWAYSGYLFDKQIIDEMTKNNNITEEFIKYIDILVDGKFVQELKNPALKFRGSSNQRIIDVQKSLNENKVILWDQIEDIFKNKI